MSNEIDRMDSILIAVIRILIWVFLALLLLYSCLWLISRIVGLFHG